jgi:hypothetical protein
MRKQIGVAKDDPVRYALKAVVDTFTYEDESLYIMNLLSKFLKNLVKYISLLAANGEEVVIAEIQAMTKSLELDIMRLQARLDVDKLPDESQKVLDEVTRILRKGG